MSLTTKQFILKFVCYIGNRTPSSLFNILMVKASNRLKTFKLTFLHKRHRTKTMKRVLHKNYLQLFTTLVLLIKFKCSSISLSDPGLSEFPLYLDLIRVLYNHFFVTPLVYSGVQVVFSIVKVDGEYSGIVM